MLVLIIIEERLMVGCFINVVLNAPRDRMGMEKGNQLSKLHRKLNM